MKNKLLIAFGILLLSGVGIYHYTHTTEYVSNAYDDAITKTCGESPVCLLGGVLAKSETVSCMKEQILSTSTKTIEMCLDRVISSNNK